MDRAQELATRLGVAEGAAKEIYQIAWADARASGISGVRPKAADIPLNRALYDEAYNHEMSISAWLEHLDPSPEYRDGLDAFERQLMLADIRTRSMPEQGLWAHRVERFFASEKPGTEYLLPEFIARKWREVSAGVRFYASSNPVSDVLYPAFLQEQVRAKKIAPAIPLSALVAITTPIDAAVYKAFYLTDASDSYTMKRVAEGAEVPTAELTGGDHTINLKKYGRRLLGSYETFRRMAIDRFALHIQLLAVKAESDKVDTAIDILVNGDGNALTTPTNSNLTTLDTAAVAGTLTLKGFLAWKMKWANPYLCNVVLAREADSLQVLLLNAGSANVPFAFLAGTFGMGGVQPINSGLGPVMLGWSSSAPSLKLVGIDNRFALEMITEVGASLTETDKIIGKQLNEIVITETVGFCVFDANANKTLDINA
jgi:hypothetical protein